MGRWTLSSSSMMFDVDVRKRKDYEQDAVLLCPSRGSRLSPRSAVDWSGLPRRLEEVQLSDNQDGKVDAIIIVNNI